MRVGVAGTTPWRGRYHILVGPASLPAIARITRLIAHWYQSIKPL